LYGHLSLEFSGVGIGRYGGGAPSEVQQHERLRGRRAAEALELSAELAQRW